MAHQVDTDMMTGSSDSSSSQRQLSATSLNLIMEDNSLPQSEMTPTSHAFPISIMNGAPSSSSHSEISLTGQLSSSPTAEDTLPGSPSPTTATETKKTLDTFTDFPKFPAELRLRVWKFTFQPRIIECFFDDGEDRLYDTKIKNPILLGINKESRDEVLRHYQLVNLANMRSKAQWMYVNFDIDTLFDASPPLSNCWNPSYSATLAIPFDSQLFLYFPRKRVQHLIKYVRQDEDAEIESFWKDLSFAFPNLKTLTLLTERRGITDPVRESVGLSFPDKEHEWYSMKHENRFVEEVNFNDLTEEDIKSRGLKGISDARKSSERKWPSESLQLVHKTLVGLPTKRHITVGYRRRVTTAH